MTAETADVAVVGAGITGLAVARALKLRGANVVVLERTGSGRANRPSSRGACASSGARRSPVASPASPAAFWREAESTLDFPVELGFRACGYLFAAHSETALERLRAERRDPERGRGSFSRIVSPAEAAALVPGLRG